VRDTDVASLGKEKSSMTALPRIRIDSNREYLAHSTIQSDEFLQRSTTGGSNKTTQARGEYNQGREFKMGNRVRDVRHLNSNCCATPGLGFRSEVRLQVGPGPNPVH